MLKDYPPDERPWRFKYAKHKLAAKYRGTEFFLTFEEWRDIWQASGKWDQRGRRSGQYCMCRTGDAGPYAVGNVRIDTTMGNGRDKIGKGKPRN